MTRLGETDASVYAGVIRRADDGSSVHRRALLTGLGGLAGAGALAGCLDRTGASTPTPGTEPTDSGDHPVTPTDTSFEVTDRTCGGGRNAATVTFDGDAVAVDGVIGGRDTCDTARLAAASLRGDVLTVVVEVVEERPTATVACAQCLTDIAYAFGATVPRRRVARVRVVHRTADGESTVATADRS